jgi:hypothetical protein
MYCSTPPVRIAYVSESAAKAGEIAPHASAVESAVTVTMRSETKSRRKPNQRPVNVYLPVQRA